MIEIAERKIIELQRNMFTIKVITTLSRFLVNEDKYQEFEERFEYIQEMYASLEKYQVLYESTNNMEYKNYFENNFHSCIESIDEQKANLYPLFSLNSLVFLENIKANIRDGFFKFVNTVINQFKTKEDVAEYICYHGSKDLNEILNYVLNFSINPNLQNLFKQVKEEHIVTYQHKEWISLGTKLNTALLDIKSKGEQDLFVDDYIYKLSGYRFLLTIFAYDI